MPTYLARHTALLLAACALWIPLQAPPAAAEGREFNGTIVRSGDGSLDVKNRMGDELRFHKSKDTAVEGKPAWKDLAKGDRVIVEYRVGKGGRNRATQVIVLRSGGD